MIIDKLVVEPKLNQELNSLVGIVQRMLILTKRPYSVISVKNGYTLNVMTLQLMNT